MASSSAARRPTTRERGGRRRRSIELFQSGKSRGLYTLSWRLNASINDSQSDDEPQQASTSKQVGTNRDDAICAKCRPILLRHRDTFKSLKKQGSSLKRVKSFNPNPKRVNFQHYRDIKGDALAKYAKKLFVCFYRLIFFWASAMILPSPMAIPCTAWLQ